MSKSHLLEDRGFAAVAAQLKSSENQLQYVVWDLLEGGEGREEVGGVDERDV